MTAEAQPAAPESPAVAPDAPVAPDDVPDALVAPAVAPSAVAAVPAVAESRPGGSAACTPRPPWLPPTAPRACVVGAAAARAAMGCGTDGRRRPHGLPPTAPLESCVLGLWAVGCAACRGRPCGRWVPCGRHGRHCPAECQPYSLITRTSLLPALNQTFMSFRSPHFQHCCVGTFLWTHETHESAHLTSFAPLRLPGTCSSEPHWYTRPPEPHW